ncbi:hypothetical protein [Pseudobutyrivibrio sp.]
MENNRALVIIRHGDEAMADAIERGVTAKMLLPAPMDSLRFMPPVYYKHSRKYWQEKRKLARLVYEPIEKPKVKKGLLHDIWMLTLYGVAKVNEWYKNVTRR